MHNRLSFGELLQLKRWNTPTIYNGWEQITRHDRRYQTNLQVTTDFMPQFGPMVGYAVTLVIEPSNPEHKANPEAIHEYRRYVASVPGPKIVVVQDLDKPNVIASHWGEVNASIHKALGCVGTVTDGAIRDVDEMTATGFKALASRLCVGHAYGWPVRWNCEVEVFGCRIQPGQLIHADKHGFIVIPEEDEARLLDAALFMDSNECDTILSSGLDAAGRSMEELIRGIAAAGSVFGANSEQKFRKKGEWT